MGWDGKGRVRYTLAKKRASPPEDMAGMLGGIRSKSGEDLEVFQSGNGEMEQYSSSPNSQLGVVGSRQWLDVESMQAD
jgi:hypothetical protein